jgi:glycosyltransferase involved in cell wall biosynthesis
VKIELSIVVSVFSEIDSVVETVDRLLKRNRGYIKEIILLVSPRSVPECIETCQKLSGGNPLIQMRIQQRNPGVGWALREGMDLATGTHVALMSGDLETEPEAVDRMVSKIEETGCDGVIGNRWMKGGGFENYNVIKYVLNWWFQQVFKILYRTKIGDITYGFKILSREITRSTPWEATLHEIFIETTLKPLRAGYILEQVPTIWIGRREGTSKNTFLRNFRYVFLALRVLRWSPENLRRVRSVHAGAPDSSGPDTSDR